MIFSSIIRRIVYQKSIEGEKDESEIKLSNLKSLELK
jgi:hypothetical protein